MDDLLVTALFRMCGERPACYIRIPNEYCGTESDCDICRGNPWWLVEIPGVGVLKLGWRKRVIEIDWSRTGVSVSQDRITEDNVTYHDRGSIHAWGYDKAIAHLMEVINCIRWEKINRQREQDDRDRIAST